jgi:hypothetical protein
MTISRHHGYTIRTIPDNWQRAKARGYAYHVTGKHGAMGTSMFGRNLEEARHLVACAIREDRRSSKARTQRLITYRRKLEALVAWQ